MQEMLQYPLAMFTFVSVHQRWLLYHGTAEQWPTVHTWVSKQYTCIYKQLDNPQPGFKHLLLVQAYQPTVYSLNRMQDACKKLVRRFTVYGLYVYTLRSAIQYWGNPPAGPRWGHKRWLIHSEPNPRCQWTGGSGSIQTQPCVNQCSPSSDERSVRPSPDGSSQQPYISGTRTVQYMSSILEQCFHWVIM